MRLFNISLILALLISPSVIGCGGVEKKARMAKPYYDKGVKYLKEGKLDKAEAEFNKAKGIMPDNAKQQWMLYHSLGKVYYKRGLLDKALEQYKIGLSIYPYDAELNYDTGEVYDKKGMTEDALERYKIAIININGNSKLEKNILIGIAKGYLKKSNYEIAFDQFKRALKLDPLFSPIHYYIAKIYQHRGKIDAALKEYERAIGMFYLMDEDNEEDRRYFAEVYKAYADILKEKGLTSQAEEQMKKYNELIDKTQIPSE